jgi:hypothetical protein
MQRKSNKFNASCNAEAERKSGALRPLTERRAGITVNIRPCEETGMDWGASDRNTCELQPLWVTLSCPDESTARRPFSQIEEELIMSSKTAKQRVIPVAEKLIAKYGCGPVHFSGRAKAL